MLVLACADRTTKSMKETMSTSLETRESTSRLASLETKFAHSKENVEGVFEHPFFELFNAVGFVNKEDYKALYKVKE